MELPLYQIKTLIRTGRINTVAEMLEYGTLEQWRKVIDLRIDVLRRMKEGRQKNWGWRHAYEIAQALDVEVEEIEAFIGRTEPTEPPRKQRRPRPSGNQ